VFVRFVRHRGQPEKPLSAEQVKQRTANHLINRKCPKKGVRKKGGQKSARTKKFPTAKTKREGRTFLQAEKKRAHVKKQKIHQTRQASKAAVPILLGGPTGKRRSSKPCKSQFHKSLGRGRQEGQDVKKEIQKPPTTRKKRNFRTRRAPQGSRPKRSPESKARM